MIGNTQGNAQGDDLLRFFGVSEEDVCTEAGLHLVCNKLRVSGAQLSAATSLLAGELNAGLSGLKGHPGFIGLDMKFKGRMVSSHLKHVSQLLGAVSLGGTRTWHSFKKHILADQRQVKRKPKRTFRFDGER